MSSPAGWRWQQRCLPLPPLLLQLRLRRLLWLLPWLALPWLLLRLPWQLLLLR
jgi:hypothetical protein